MNENEKLTGFDLNALRLNQDYASLVGVKKQIVVVPVGRPNKQVFFRVRPGEEYRLTCAILELKEDGASRPSANQQSRISKSGQNLQEGRQAENEK